jgi:hypothetical protein
VRDLALHHVPIPTALKTTFSYTSCLRMDISFHPIICTHMFAFSATANTKQNEERALKDIRNERNREIPNHVLTSTQGEKSK